MLRIAKNGIEVCRKIKQLLKVLCLCVCLLVAPGCFYQDPQPADIIKQNKQDTKKILDKTKKQLQVGYKAIKAAQKAGGKDKVNATAYGQYVLSLVQPNQCPYCYVYRLIIMAVFVGLAFFKLWGSVYKQHEKNIKQAVNKAVERRLRQVQSSTESSVD